VSRALVEVVRGDLVESLHRGSLVVVDSDGSVLRAVGHVDVPIYPRSANKPMQAAALVRAGAPLEGPRLALAAASHSGEARHVEAVRALLADAGLDESALGCPPDYPLGEAARVAWIRARRDPAPVAMNCSGKHAAMLATCVARGWSVPGYLGVDHPLQRACRVEIEDRAREKVAAVAVDGCGAPVFALTLTGLARAVSSCVQAEPGSAPRRVADAMRSWPELVAGTGRDVTELMAGVPGLLAKDGADGVFVAALPDGRAVALKVDDGADRARPPAVVAALRWLGVGEDDEAAAAVLQRWAAAPVLGGGRPVGEVRAVGGLLD
jgi:L-asparaginase II